MVNLILPIYNKLFSNSKILDSKKDNYNEKQLKKLILRTACEAHFEPCIEWAQDLYKTWMDSKQHYNP